MDRDRDRDRRLRDLPRDIPPEDRYGSGGGQSYRPSNVRDRSPRMDSYRARTPPRREFAADTYRVPRGRSRSPPRRDDYRRRSPSQRGFRDRELRGGDSYRGRPRSPPPPTRREELQRDDLFRRDPVRNDRRDYRDERDRGAYVPAPRSPQSRFRERSPVQQLKRGREASPISSRGRRSPPPKRERLASPPRRLDDYPPSRAVSQQSRRFSPVPRDRRPSPPRDVGRNFRPRSRSPAGRNERVDPRAVDDWRRPRSPVRESRQDFLSRDESGQASGATSRRSSPPMHPSRMALQQPAVEERAMANTAPPRDPYDERQAYRATEPQARRGDTHQEAELPYQDERRPAFNRERSLPTREPPRQDEASASTPGRAPPTGPGGFRTASVSMAPPTGPSSSGSIPSGPRGSGPPPSGPRGAPAPRGDFSSRGDFASRGRAGFVGDFAQRGRSSFSASFRGARGGASGPTASGFQRSDSLSRSVSASDNFSNARDNTSQEPASRPPPSGPRGSFGSQPPSTPAYRPSNNTSTTTFPRSQRFGSSGESLSDIPTGPKAGRRPTEPLTPSAPRVHPAIADLPKIIEGGKKLEPIIDRTKIHKLEEEAEKLRLVIDEKETRLRKSLHEWERMQREIELAALRSELAEEALRALNGEAEAQAAF